MKRCILIGLLLIAGTHLYSLDRNAFAITSYRLDAQIDRNSHVLAVTGRLILRNDSKSSQKTVSLQISSQLDWNGIGTDGKAMDCDCIAWPAEQQLEWLRQNYTSDIDHTGSLSEAIVTLQHAVAPGASVALDIQYGGRVTPDATRLTRIGVPKDVALRNDWDQISDAFTAVRGLGYTVWYPVSIDAVSMSEGNSVSDAIAAWNARERRSRFVSNISVTVQNPSDQPCILSNAATGASDARESAGTTHPENPGAKPAENYPQTRSISLEVARLDETAPAFVVLSSCDKLARPTVELNFTPEHSLIAKDYAAAAESNDSLLDSWLPQLFDRPMRIIELTDPDATPYQEGATLFVPLHSAIQQNLQVLFLPTQVAAHFGTPRPWMQRGLGFFMQAIFNREHNGRDAALKFLDQYEAPLAKAEELARTGDPASKSSAPKSDSDNTLLNTSDEVYLRVKGGFVFWMLHDMLGDTAMQHALAAYRPEADREPTYFQKLLEAQSKHDLEWFFDAWVYRDRGLPDFHIDTAFSRKLLSAGNEYQVTVTVSNLGGASAEVPVVVESAHGTRSVRVLVRAHDKGYARVELPELPTRVVVNDGSVPEGKTGNNVYVFENKPQ